VPVAEDDSVKVEQVRVELVRPLRLAVLRPGWAPESVVYPEDDAPSATHFAAWRDYLVAGTLSLYAEPPPVDVDVERGRAWRMRGVAVRDDVRGGGVGRALVVAAEEFARTQRGEVIWCNGRVSAQPFYERLGYQPWGDVFDSVGIPHVVLWRPL
jgi:GNAT superfamily N-acetyltransferase